LICLALLDFADDPKSLGRIDDRLDGAGEQARHGKIGCGPGVDAAALE
jgi:hypothetical protein